MRLVLDTNIFISSLNFGGTPDLIMKEVYDGKIEVVISNEILDELGKVLKDKFNWEDSKILEARRNLEQLCVQVDPKLKMATVLKDPSDNKILECAAEGKVDYIITGDRKHLLPLKKFQGIPIMSPQEFLKEVFYN